MREEEDEGEVKFVFCREREREREYLSVLACERERVCVRESFVCD